ncbi:hypothetical protein C0389_01980 [bacterium]|nr:hypothetical protein [bacterium]
MIKENNRPLLFESTWSTKFWLLPDTIETGYFIFQRSEISYKDLGKFAQDVSELINEHVCNIINYGNLEFIEIANGYMSSEELRRINELWDRMNKRRLESGNERINPPNGKTGRMRTRNFNLLYAD